MIHQINGVANLVKEEMSRLRLSSYQPFCLLLHRLNSCNISCNCSRKTFIASHILQQCRSYLSSLYPKFEICCSIVPTTLASAMSRPLSEYLWYGQLAQMRISRPFFYVELSVELPCSLTSYNGQDWKQWLDLETSRTKSIESTNIASPLAKKYAARADTKFKRPAEVLLQCDSYRLDLLNDVLAPNSILQSLVDGLSELLRRF